MAEQSLAPLNNQQPEVSNSSDKPLSPTEQRIILGEIENDNFTIYFQQQTQLNSRQNTCEFLKDLSKKIKFSFPQSLQCDSKQIEFKTLKYEIDKTQILKIPNKNMQTTSDNYFHQLDEQAKNLSKLNIQVKQEFICKILKLAMKMITIDRYVPLCYFRCTENCSIYLPFGFISSKTLGIVEFPSIKQVSSFVFLKDLIKFISRHDKNHDCFSPVPMTPQHLILNYIQAHNSHPYYIAIIQLVFVLSLFSGIFIFRYVL